MHTTGYALIALQEMNLASRFPIIYWNCACLSVDSSAVNSMDFYNLIDENIIDDEEVEGKKVQNKINYSKIATALDKFRKVCNIEVPDINESRLGFTPNAKNNTILYGLKGISRITSPVIEEIFLKRPFTSLDDFLDRVTTRIITKDKVVNLIKSGAFDNLYKGQKTRQEIMKDFIWITCEPKQKLTLQNANKLIDLDLFPKELEEECDVYKMTKELRKHRDSQKMWYKVDELNIPFNKIDSWRELFRKSDIGGCSMVLDNIQGKYIDSAKWDNFYETKMDVLRNFLKNNKDSMLNNLNNALFDNEWNKYCKGDLKEWELNSLNFYFSGKHPLYNVLDDIASAAKIESIDKVSDIVEGTSDGFFLIKGKQIPKMHLYTIAGTVIDRDKVKGLVTLQTCFGVVNIKCYKDLYAIYAQQISSFDEEGNKIVEEESFFEKGVHLLVTGIQKGSTFVPKVYKNTGRKSIERILLNDNGSFLGLQQKGE